MSTTTDLTTLKINYLTQAQYDAAKSQGLINDDELYLTPATDSGINDVTVDGVSVVTDNVAEITMPTVPTKVSDLTNDVGYITDYTETDPTVPSWAKASSKPSYTASEVGAVPTSRTINGKALTSNITLSASDVSALPSSTVIPTVNNATLTIQKNGSTVKTFTANASSNVAANITVPTATSDLTNDAGYITGYTETDPVFLASAAHGITSSNISSWNGKYTKPSTGIPKTDLATAVQTSLGKADTALQSYTETDPVFVASAAHGITSANITSWNNKSDFSGSYDDLTDKPTIPTVPSNVSAFNNDAGYLTSYTETDPTVPAWAKQASKPSYTASEVGAQPTLVSGTNIKTVNNESLLGSGNLTFQSLGLLDFVYPVGSYYETSDASFNPNTAWGGTWSLEAEGLVHIGAGSTYTIGDVGGEAEVTLTIDEMPSHNHSLPNVMGYVYSTAGGNGTYGAVTTWRTVGNTGGDKPHNNMPPYIVVNRWHRTA